MNGKKTKIATWHLSFQGGLFPSIEFCKVKLILVGCNSMLHNNWLDIPWVIGVHLFFFYFRPTMVSYKYTRRNIFNYVTRLISQGQYNERCKFVLSPKSACFRTQVCPWETFELHFLLVKWFSLQHQSLSIYLKIHITRSTIFMINICIYNHHSKVFMSRENEGVENFVWGNVRVTN